MKIKKIIIFIITIIFVMSSTVSYGASKKVPSADASVSEIKEYVEKYGCSDISEKKLRSWWDTVNSSDDYDGDLLNQINSAIRSAIISSDTEDTSKKDWPEDKDDATVIKSYVENNSISEVPIETLVSWFKVLKKDTGFNSNSGSMMIYSKIKNALKAKSKADIEEYVKSESESELVNTKLSDVLEHWSEKKGIDTNVKKKINKAVKEIDSSIVDEYEEEIDDSVSNPIVNPDEYAPGQPKSEKIKGIIGPILGAINNVGVVISIIALMLIGVKYMLGSVEEKANYKQTLWPYIIGIFVLFMGSTIPNIIYKTLH